MCTLTNKIFEGDKEYIYTYQIIKSEVVSEKEKSKLNYGIKADIEVIDGKELEFQYDNCMEDISSDIHVVEGFISKICRYCVSPININEVIEDLLIQRA